MSKWIAEFDLEDGDKMPEHMDLNYMGAKIDFHCRPMWIPVSERLPEESQTEDGYFYPSDMVLTFNSHGQYGVSRYWGNRISKKERPNDYLDWMDLPFYRQDILAWQPLPEPYKEGGE